MRVMMLPRPNSEKPGASGIDRVVEAYYRHLPDYDIELVSQDSDIFDLLAVHISCHNPDEIQAPIVQHVHGLHWTSDYECASWQYKVNAGIINTLRYAKEITVPSGWVAETFQRDMRMSPHVIPHGIDWHDWHHSAQRGDYILWNKNRAIDVCDATPVAELARRFPNNHFVTTFLPDKMQTPSNTNVTGLIPHKQMKHLVQSSLVYLSTTKETFGIGVLEAMASGVPVLGFAHGGNVDLIEHGISGYLAQPGNYDDLETGLAYCLQHHQTLSANGRELARKWNWDSVCERVAEVYSAALESEPATASIVIPVYNKTGEQVKRAVNSACLQSYFQSDISLGDNSIRVVNDGSDNEAAEDYVALLQEIKRANPTLDIGYSRISNSGVANARNTGISGSSSKYICCLDSDDAIEPGFIEKCVNRLERDPSLGIAYTSLRYITPDGETGISQWPGKFDYDQQLRQQNQIPTCCVFRRKIWERLGGYNQKYAPDGCGAEDAEFWLRCGAYGWKAQKITDIPMFVYSWKSGIVSGNPDYKEPDWLAMHPWVKDGQHPFASVATPKKFSHPVRQYDEPGISVIIPVGPGHETKVRNALDSLEAQTYRKWEVIVVWDAWKENYEPQNETVAALNKAYPYVRWGAVVTNSNTGPGYARNRGAEIARAPFLVFLDADDWLHPDCLAKMIQAWRDHESVIYTDYVGKAFVENPQSLDPVLQRRLYNHNERTNEAVIGYKAADFDCELAQSQPQPNPYIWCNVTAFIPKVWHDEIGGFDESMSSWEDVDYHWRMARNGKCYYRIEEELMVYQFHTGHRRERGRQTHESLLQYIREKYERIEIVPCQGCGGSRNRNNRSSPQASAFSQRRQAVAQMNDSDFVLVEYRHRNKGRHQVTGGYLFQDRLPGIRMRNRGNGWSIDYGQRGGGEKFLVHRADVSVQQHFIPVRESVAQIAPEPVREPLPEPELVAQEIESDLVKSILEPPEIKRTDADDIIALQAWDIFSQRGDIPCNDDIEQCVTDLVDLADANDWLAGYSALERGHLAIELFKLAQAEIDSIQVSVPEKFDLQLLPGVGPALASQLEANGIMTKDDVIKLGVEGLQSYHGVGQTKAERIFSTIARMNT